MAKPKPPEEMEQFSIRFPKSLAARIKVLAELSNDGMGVSFTRYLNAIAQEATENEITINEVRRYELSGSLAGVGQAMDKARDSAAKLGKALQAAQPKRKKPKSTTRRSA